MALKRINYYLNKLDWKQVKTALFSSERAEDDPGVEVCDASFEEWEKYVQSEKQVLKSRAMAFENGKIYIVELPAGIQQTFSSSLGCEVIEATGTRTQHLRPFGSTYVQSLQKLEPDCCFGPVPGLGAIRPEGVKWGEYHTLKVKVGMSRSRLLLHRKADQWRQFPGVEYIFCVHLSQALDV